MRKKRVEYQKFLRTKLEDERYRHLFGLSDNVELELELRPEHYAWLLFAEGKKYEAYIQQLSESIAQDERHQIYLDILRELEQEGKDRMAYEVISRIIAEMPPERREELLLNLPAETLFGTLNRLPAEQLQAITQQLSEIIAQNGRHQIYLNILRELEQEGKDRMAYEVISRIISEMPPERREELLLNLPAETLFGTLNRLPAEQLQAILAGLPKEQLQKALEVNSDGTTPINKKETQG